MLEESLSTFIVPLVSILSVVITHVLILIQNKKSLIFQTRAKFFQEAYQDQLTVMFYNEQIELGIDVEKNAQRIQDLLEKHPHNFSYSFLARWFQIKEQLTGSKSKRLDGIKAVIGEMEGTRKLYSIKYLTEVLGLNKLEVKQFLTAMKGTMQNNSQQKSKSRFERLFKIIIIGIFCTICYMVMWAFVWFGNPLLPVESLANFGFAQHHIPELLCFFFFGFFLAEIANFLHGFHPGKNFIYVDIIYLLVLFITSTIEFLLGFSPLVVIPIVTLPSFIGYFFARWNSNRMKEQRFLKSLSAKK